MIVSLDITARTPLADGAAFGAAGAYKRIEELAARDPRPSLESREVGESRASARRRAMEDLLGRRLSRAGDAERYLTQK